MNFRNITNPDNIPVDGDVVSWTINNRTANEVFDYGVFERLMNISKRQQSEGLFPIDFRHLFNFSELSAIDNHQFSDTFTVEMKANINTFINTYNSANRIYLDDPDTIEAIGMLVLYGVISQERSDDILIGKKP